MLRSHRRGLACVGIILCALISGCIKTTQQGDATVYSFETWVGGMMIVGGLIAPAIGWALRKQVARLGYALLIGGPLLLLFSPTFFMDKATVDSEHFEASYGFWFAPSRVNIRYDDCSEFRVVVTEKRGRRGRKTKEYSMDCVKKSGGAEKVPLGTLLQEAAGEILERAAAKGVIVSGTGIGGDGS